jgi:predicted AAA+ superfamily ATPase
MELTGIALDQNPWWEAPHYRPVLHLTERRSMFDRLYTALANPQQNRAQILLGPRQVGKSTLLLQIVGKLLEAEVPPANVTFFDFSDDRLVPRNCHLGRWSKSVHQSSFHLRRHRHFLGLSFM